MLYNSQQGNFFSVRDRNQQWETAARWVILWHWEDFSIPPFPSHSLSLSAAFLLFMTLLKNDKSYVLVVYWQKCCEGIREDDWLFVFYTTFSSFTPKHAHEKLMLGLSFAEHTHICRMVRWSDTHINVSSSVRGFIARWRGGTWRWWSICILYYTIHI